MSGSARVDAHAKTLSGAAKLFLNLGGAKRSKGQDSRMIPAKRRIHADTE